MALTLLLGFAAVNTGNNLLFLVVAALLAFMAVTGLAGWYNLRGLEADIRVPDEVYGGITTLVSIGLRNRKRRLPSFLLRLQYLGAEGVVLLLDRGVDVQCALPCVFPRRGRHPVPELLVTSPFPVNFFVRRLRCGCPGEVTVFPAPLPCPGSAAADGRERDGVVARSARGHDGELARIGDYSGREPLKSVHWRLTARHGDLKVKEFDACGTEPVVVDVATLPAATDEERLGRAAYLVNDLMRRHRPVGLRLAGRLLPPGLSRPHRLHLLQELALHAAD